MRILILANIDMGLYKFRRELLETLVQEHEVYFCVPKGELVKRIEELGCKYILCTTMDRRSTNPFKDLSLLQFYVTTIKKLRPNIVLTYTIKPNVYGGIACQRTKVPYISNVTGLGTTIENGGILSIISKSLYKIGLRKANCVFFQNSDNQNLFVNEKIAKCRTRLIPGSGVNLNMYFLEPYPSDLEGIHFLFVGRIMKDKGIEELIKAATEIHRNKPNVIVDIVGFCEEDYGALLDKAEKEGVIINHGIQTNVHPFYRKAHCVVLPSYHEGMANVMLEASATGRPVITTYVPGCQETFDENITGFGCNAKDSESLTCAMNKFLDLPQKKREEMGRAARRKMESEYDRSIVIEAYKDEISNIVQTSTYSV